MRTRNQAKRQTQSPNVQEEVKTKKRRGGDLRTRNNSLKKEDIRGTVSDISEEAAGKFLKEESYTHTSSCLRQCDSATKIESGREGGNEQCIGTMVSSSALDAECSSRDVVVETEDEFDGSDWEDGSIPTLCSTHDYQEDTIKGLTVEFEVPPDPTKRKRVRRATSEEKELAELMHKVHLLCLIGRGRLIDSACNDPLIQASLLSLLPTHLLKIAEAPRLTVNALAPLVSWFHKHFRVRGVTSGGKTVNSALAAALETREGTAEEVAALSIALFRALNLTTRFVSILDVVSLKPEADKCEFTGQDPSKSGSGIFKSSTLMVAGSNHSSPSPSKPSRTHKDNVCETSSSGANKTGARKVKKNACQLKDSSFSEKLKNQILDSSAPEIQNDTSDSLLSEKSDGRRRKGDLEFEMQLQMALSATSIENSKRDLVLDKSCSQTASPFKRNKNLAVETESPTSAHAISTAFGSRKMGAPLYWAEVYCNGENMTGKWVHVDAVNAIIDGEHKVEAAAAACKTSLRYAVAFAGHGAKDVTHRYCMKWYKIATRRINPHWWDEVLAPLKNLESGATGGVVHLKQDEEMEVSQAADNPTESSVRNSLTCSRSSLEDMELETRALTEPLPTNQQAYRNHGLYAIERWLKKYEILYPKGPILGFCAGQPVYPRSCVQLLHTKERWLREGLQVKVDELPAKVLKRSKQTKTSDVEDEGLREEDHTVELYGKWQTVPLILPHAVNGIVPKNERGQVDVWSEKCLPPGTVHLRLSRIASVAKRLDIDFAPAMVGFEFRNGRSYPVFEGIVVCAEFKDAILEAYAEEEERREAVEKKRKEAEALTRWYQLLSSIVTRQRLNNCYGEGATSRGSVEIPKPDDSCFELPGPGGVDRKKSPKHQEHKAGNEKSIATQSSSIKDHEHVFVVDDQTPGEESLTRTKRCHCGFFIQFEEL